MNGLRHLKKWLLATILGASLLFLQPARAQQVPPTASPAQSFTKSPVDFFRELLAMTPEEQEAYLAKRPPAQRERLRAKIEEYSAMDANERELRLQTTELHWYLLPLMKIPATQRTNRLARIPPQMRELVKQRLQLWNLLPPPLKQEILENEEVASIFVRSEKVTDDQLKQMLENISPSRRAELEKGIERWQSMPEQQRQRLCKQFSMFFDLTPQEKEEALSTFSDAERKQMDKTLQAFEKLPKDQRTACIQSFQKFTDLSLPERELFLRNAQLWKAMSPDARQAWRDLVRQVPNWPPLPPGFPENRPRSGD